MLRTLLACLTIFVVAAVGTDYGQLLRARGLVASACCCGPAGAEHGCECTGPCCTHAPGHARDRSVPGYDDHCGARAAAPALATSLQPGTPATVRVPRPAVVAARYTARDAALPVRAFSAPPEPPPRTPVA